MRPQHWISIAGIATTAMLGLQAATFTYVLRVEERLTRLETIAAIHQAQLGLAAARGQLAPIVPANGGAAQMFGPAP